MRIKQANSENRASYSTVKIVGIDKTNRVLKCLHENGLTIRVPYSRGSAELSVGQYIGVVYRTKGYIEGYTVADTLMDTIEARVIDVQRMVQGDRIYVSIVFENRNDKSKRMFSCISSNSKNFANASVLVKGDIAKVRVNNGQLFDILELGISGY